MSLGIALDYQNHPRINNEHFPIPYGGLRVLILLLLLALELFAILSTPGNLKLATTVISTVATMAIWYAMFGGRVDRWFLNYWDRNVRGRYVEFYHSKEHRLSYMLLGRGHNLKGYFDQSFVLPLGGWIQRPRVRFNRLKYSTWTNSWPVWRIRRFNKTDQVINISIVITDTSRNCVNLGLADAFELIFRTDYGCIGPAISQLMKLNNERAAVLQQRIVADSMVFQIIADAVRDIAATTRFGKSKEGQRIRLGLIEKTLMLLPKGSTLGSEFENYLKQEAPEPTI